MGLFERHLRELGERVEDGFLALARSGDGSTEALATTLASWPSFFDVSPYPSGDVPFFKRAQIAAADLALAGIAPARRPRPPDAVRRQPRPARAAHRRRARVRRRARRRIDAGTLLEHDSPEEVEIRAMRAACRRAARRRAPETTTAAAVDWVLWSRGAAPRYKAHPRHRARTTAY